VAVNSRPYARVSISIVGNLSFWIVVACLGPAHAAVFAGKVLEDHTGNPLARAEIRIFRPRTPGIVAELETDGQGRFQTPELPDSDYLLRVSKADYATVELASRGRSDLLLRLTRFGAIAGKIWDAEGRPVPAHVVALTPTDATAGMSDGNAAPGEYRIYDLPPGSYRVAIFISGEGRGRRGVLLQPNNSSPREFTVAGGEDYAGADFTLPGDPAFRISAKAEGVASGSVLFSLIAAGHPGRQVAQQLVPVDRPFTVEDVRPGSYELLAFYGGAANPTAFGRTPVTVVAGDVEDVRVPLDQARSASFTLRAQEPCAGDAVAELTATEAWVTYRPVTVPLSAGKPATLATLAPARYSVTAKAAAGNCYAIAEPLLDLVRESASRPVEIALLPAGSIQGHLKGAAHPANYAVILTPSDGAAVQIALPDEKGEFRFADLRPGSYLVRARGPGNRWMGGPMAPDTPVAVSGGAPTSLELTVNEAIR
jgi:hypothetical protein